MLEAKISEMNRPSSSTDIAHKPEEAKPAEAKSEEAKPAEAKPEEAKPEEATSEEFRYSKEPFKAYGRLGGRPKRTIDECLVSMPQHLLRSRKAKT